MTHFQVEALAEDAFDTLIELFGNPFKEKITVIIGGYEDRSNGLANPVLGIDLYNDSWNGLPI